MTTADDPWTADTTTVRAADSLREAEWLQLVDDLAKWRGWRSYHTADSRRSAPGFPDICAVRSGRLLFAEMKSATGRLTVDQRRWLADLSACPGAEVHVWRPSDWPTVQRVLR